MDKLTIDRGLLLTGTALQNLMKAGKVAGGRLLDARSGLMCCLGVYCASQGVPAHDLDGVGMPSAIGYAGPEKWLKRPVTDAEAKSIQRDSKVIIDVQDAIAQTNDNPKLHPSRREARIAKLFKKYGGIDVTFTGSYRESTAKARARLAA